MGQVLLAGQGDRSGRVSSPARRPTKQPHFRGHLSRSFPSTRPAGRDALGQFRLTAKPVGLNEPQWSVAAARPANQ
jgi:hypothetical protein